MENKRLYTRIETAKMLSISVDTLDRLVDRKTIRSQHIGSRVVFLAEEIDRFVVMLARRGTILPYEEVPEC